MSNELSVYHFEIYTGSPSGEPIDTKYCFRSWGSATAKARALKKEHKATKVRVEHNDTLKVKWV